MIQRYIRFGLGVISVLPKAAFAEVKVSIQMPMNTPHAGWCRGGCLRETQTSSGAETFIAI